MVHAERLRVIQNVSLGLNGHNMVTRDHGQAQNSGFPLGESVLREGEERGEKNQ